MNKEGVYEPGDEITVNGVTLQAVMADTDGSGCYVCDDGHNKCWFLDKKGIPCPKCHSSKAIFIDYVGHRVVFLPKNKNL